MDYDDIDYDEGYSIRDIDNDWFNGNMDYETDFDSDSDMDDYNYNYNNNTNNWNILLHSHYLLLVSVGQPKDLLANHSFALVNPVFVSQQTGVCLGGPAMEFPKEVVSITRIPMVSNSSTSNY